MLVAQWRVYLFGKLRVLLKIFQKNRKILYSLSLQTAEILDEEIKRYSEQNPVGDAWRDIWQAMLQEEREVFSQYPALIFSLQEHGRQYLQHCQRIEDAIAENLFR